LPSQDEAGNLGKTLGSARHKLLVDFIISKREAAGLTQAQLAGKLGEYQSFVARLESGQRRIDVVEFIEIATALKFDPSRAIVNFLKAD
jgi:transcriptional regulator with XRE-family HTH domain